MKTKQKTTEDFADVLLKLLNPGVPYGKMHPQKEKLVAKLREREETIYNAGLERAVEVVEGMDTLTSEQNLHLGELIVKDELLTQLQAEVNKDKK